MELLYLNVSDAAAADSADFEVCIMIIPRRFTERLSVLTLSHSSMSTLITKHEKFWFLDGNIILSIPSTGEPDSASDDTCSATRPNRRKRARRTEENLDASSYASSLSTRRTLFRVHKGILAKHSPVFEGMFTLPDPAESTNAARSRVGFGYDAHGHLNKEYEGAPVVELSDTMEQVEQLIGALYDPLYVPLPRAPLTYHKNAS